MLVAHSIGANDLRLLDLPPSPTPTPRPPRRPLLLHAHLQARPHPHSHPHPHTYARSNSPGWTATCAPMATSAARTSGRTPPGRYTTTMGGLQRRMLAGSAAAASSSSTCRRSPLAPGPAPASSRPSPPRGGEGRAPCWKAAGEGAFARVGGPRNACPGTPPHPPPTRPPATKVHFHDASAPTQHPRTCPPPPPPSHPTTTPTLPVDAV